MTTRPYLVAFAACVAGMVATGVPLVALMLGVPLGVWVLGWLLSAVPVFCLVAATVMHLENQAAVAKHRHEMRQLQVSTAEREWNLRQAKHAAAVTSGQAGAREAEVQERAWQVGLEILFRSGDKAGGFSGRKLAGCVGSDVHPMLMDFYTSPAGLCILENAGSSVGHRWGRRPDGETWTLDDVLRLLGAGRLPHPDGKVPEIRPLPASATQRNTPRKGSGAAGAVVEGVARVEKG